MFRRLKVIAMTIALLLCVSACGTTPQKEDARELQAFAGYEQISSYPNIFFETQEVGTDLEEIYPGWSYVYYNVQNKEIYFIDPLNCKAAILCKMYEPDGSLKIYNPNHEYSPLVVVNEDNASMNDDGAIYLYDPENYVMYSYTMDECGEVIRLLDTPKLFSPEGDEA